MKCGYCGKEYHSCSLCSGNSPRQRHYMCSEECWKKSDTYIEHIEKAKKFFDSMTREQLDFWENEGLWEDDYFKEYDDMTKERRKSLDNYILKGKNVR